MPHPPRLSTIAPLALLFLTGACVVADGGPDGEAGPFYPAGFTDGCQTAQNVDGSFTVERVRDDALFETEASYRSGWRAGYGQCGMEPSLTPRPGDLGAWEPL